MNVYHIPSSDKPSNVCNNLSSSSQLCDCVVTYWFYLCISTLTDMIVDSVVVFILGFVKEYSTCTQRLSIIGLINLFDLIFCVLHFSYCLHVIKYVIFLAILTT